MELRVLGEIEDETDKLFDSEECRQLLEIYKDYYPKIGFNLPWVAYLIIQDNQVVGTCSFTGKPKDGMVEIAYWTFKAFEGMGIGSFACKALVTIGQKADPKITITAKTEPRDNASTKILKKNGFTFSEIVKDEEIGDAWLWTLKKN